MTGQKCRFADGAFAGQSIAQAWPKMSAEWTGTAIDSKRDFPLLVKFLFTEDKLSVQVHPGDEYAAQFESESGGCGKTEMWYALRARPGAEVLVGLKPEVTADDFKRAIADGTAERFLTHIPVHAGDAIFVPAGAAHTIGPGLLLCEIQQHSDITYRVYDYDRPGTDGRMRPLHIEKALEVMRFGPQTGGKIQPVQLKYGTLTETYLTACPYFATEKWEFAAEVFKETCLDHFDVLIFLGGHGNICWRDHRVTYRPTEVWMIPAALGKYQLRPDEETSVLRTYVPRDLKEFAGRLASAGIQESEILRLIHP